MPPQLAKNTYSTSPAETRGKKKRPKKNSLASLKTTVSLRQINFKQKL
jgi:hypothetical protein